jgi:catechol 2,3-dioxygenase-like lactoylglutathione lyase family enzyme
MAVAQRLHMEEAIAVIIGAHAVLFSREPEAVRAFLRDVLGLGEVDAGGGWPIFALPPAEAAVHPADQSGEIQLYLMCDDLEATLAGLRGKGVEASRPVREERWGRVTAIALPDGAELGLYQPHHPLAISPAPASPS